VHHRGCHLTSEVPALLCTQGSCQAGLGHGEGLDRHEYCDSPDRCAHGTECRGGWR
jgi:hypothetical protein